MSFSQMYLERDTFFHLKQFSKCTHFSLLLLSVIILHSNSCMIQTMIFCSTLENCSHKVCSLLVLSGTGNFLVYFLFSLAYWNSKNTFLRKGMLYLLFGFV